MRKSYCRPRCLSLCFAWTGLVSNIWVFLDEKPTRTFSRDTFECRFTMIIATPRSPNIVSLAFFCLYSSLYSFLSITLDDPNALTNTLYSRVYFPISPPPLLIPLFRVHPTVMVPFILSSCLIDYY